MNTKEKIKKNVLFVVDERRMGGVSVLLEDMMNMINLNKYNIDILSLHNNGEMLENLPKGVNLIFGTSYFDAVDYTYKEVIKTCNPFFILKKICIVLDMKFGTIEKKIRKQRSKILNKKYDVEIAFKDGFTALFTAFGDSKKKIHWLHYEYKKTNPNAKYDELFKKILPEFDEIISVSEGVKDAFNDLYHLENKTKVIYNLVDTNKILLKSKEECNIKLNKNNLNIVSVGRLHTAKGYDRFFNVIEKLQQDGFTDRLNIDIYGDGPDYHYLKEIIKTKKIDNIVSLRGKVYNPYKYIKKYQLFVLPSNFESFGLVVIESMSLGVPVISTLTSATNRIIDDRNNGYITDNSEEGLYEGLKYLITHPDEIIKYKENLKKYKYENKLIVKQIEDVLDK